MDRNLILTIALSLLIFLGWNFLVLEPKQKEYREQQAAAELVQASNEAQTQAAGVDDSPFDDLSSGVDGTPETQESAVQTAGRVDIDTPSLTGSINLLGARFDDLKLKKYHEEVDKSSPIITLFTSKESEFGHYAESGINSRVSGMQTEKGSNVVWSAPEGAKLTPTTPVTLTRSSNGLNFEMKISVDENYMFTIDHKVTNASGKSAAIAPYGLTIQKGMDPTLRNFPILHEGPVGVVGTELYERKYKNVYKKKQFEEEGTGGWVGLTSKNWLAAVIPDQSLTYDAKMGYAKGTTKNDPRFISRYQVNQQTLENGETYTTTSYVYGGSKLVDILQSYEAAPDQGGLGIQDFDKAVDWGNFFFLTRPMFYTLHFFAGLTGNYGIAILLLVIVVKALLFYFANKSYASMANMRKVTPEMTRIREMYEDDKMKQQQEMMALYKKHNINPLAGCLPMLIQIPVFYALYKTLFVTIETRHEPFLYIKDLSAPDPAMIFNLFGLLPYDPSTVPFFGIILGIGILPLLMGAAMWVQMRLNPPPADPIQAQVFGFMPLIFMFIMSPFAAGLVLYWFWNTFLGVVQQYFIMKRHGTDVDLLGNIKQTFSKKDKTDAANDDGNDTNMFGGKSKK